MSLGVPLVSSANHIYVYIYICSICCRHLVQGAVHNVVATVATPSAYVLKHAAHQEVLIDKFFCCTGWQLESDYASAEAKGSSLEAAETAEEGP